MLKFFSKKSFGHKHRIKYLVLIKSSVIISAVFFFNFQKHFSKMDKNKCPISDFSFEN